MSRDLMARRAGQHSPPPRAVVDAVFPEVDAGRYFAKRSLGERVDVRAHVFADGHDLLSVVLLHRARGASSWTETPMRELGNDEWDASFTPDAVGQYEYTVEGWVDQFATWAADLRKRVDAGWDISSELLEGAALVSDSASRVPWPDAEHLRWVAQRLADASIAASVRTTVALDPALAELMSRTPDRAQATRYERVLCVDVERERARFGAWYELFPRSAGTDPTRSATFREAAARLPDIQAMGFDVLYLPPIHPIGHTARKGSNNTLNPGPNDPGSPWAIGSEAGGHTAVHPDLGTLEDFDWFLAEAERHGIEIALDMAFQCSPDHPWVREHPEWFRQRPDGTIRYAENPPKQYQDIYPLNFDSPDWQGLWAALRDVVLFWARRGVKIFRVDNPHTKPFPFWEWLIREVRAQHPDSIFLAEAFTRPKRLEGLAKLGYSQSYSYFTWRNTKAEIREYFTELTTPPKSDYLRANLFANTPDILHEYLQVGGRPAFLVRLILAATLGPSYGIYSGFELCEGEAVAEGSEEYMDSDKYQVKPRDWDAPGNIKPAVTRVNQLRREYEALQHNHHLWFLPIENDQIVAYIKADLNGQHHVLTLVNVDVNNAQSGWVGLPLGALGLRPDEQYEVHDVLNDARYSWRGEWNYVRLDPNTMPAMIAVFPKRTPEAAAPATAAPEPTTPA